MNPLIAITPALLLLLVVAVLITTIFQFDQLRWSPAKDFLSRFWSPGRRRVLHLEKQNGFFFFVSRIIDWLDGIMRFSWMFVLPAFIGGIAPAVGAGLVISVTHLLRFGSLTLFASKRVRHFTMPPDYDAYGVYARSASDWTACKDELRHPLVVSAISTLILTYALFDVAW